MIWAATNHVDKYLLNRFFKNTSGWPLVIMSALSSFFVLPVIAILFPGTIIIGLVPIIILLVLGLSFVLTCSLYLKALSKDEPSVVVPMFQLIAVFNYFLGLVFLHEHLTLTQIIACSLIIIGAIAISLDLTGNKFRIKKEVLTIMILDCIIIAVYDLVFKYVVLQSNFWGSMFWSYVSFGLFGIAILALSKKSRNQFLKIFERNKISLVGLNLINEIANIIASFIFNYALVIMPIAIVSVVGNGLQPFFVFFFGVILTIFLPHFGQEKVTKHHIFQRVVAIFIIFIGSYLLNR